MQSAVIDASIAVKAVTSEEYSANTLVLLRTVPSLHAPAHWLAEAANALWSKVAVRKTLAAHLLRPRLIFLSRMPILAAPLPSLAADAGDIAQELHLTVHDALYLALAERLRSPLVTDDRKLITAASGKARYAGLVIWIADVT